MQSSETTNAHTHTEREGDRERFGKLDRLRERGRVMERERERPATSDGVASDGVVVVVVVVVVLAGCLCLCDNLENDNRRFWRAFPPTRNVTSSIFLFAIRHKMVTTDAIGLSDSNDLSITGYCVPTRSLRQI